MNVFLSFILANEKIIRISLSKQSCLLDLFQKRRALTPLTVLVMCQEVELKEENLQVLRSGLKWLKVGLSRQRMDGGRVWDGRTQQGEDLQE